VKKVALWIVVALVAMSVFLVVASHFSTAHKAAMEFLNQQDQLKQALGPDPTFVLIGFHSKERAGGAGCTRLTYWMVGEKGRELVRAKMSMQGDHEKWELDQFIVGFSGKLDTRCDYKRQ
jgi:hypothetical protein